MRDSGINKVISLKRSGEESSLAFNMGKQIKII